MADEYDHGIECASSYDGHNHQGWAVFTGVEGEDPMFRGYFLFEDDARVFAESLDADGDPVCFDPAVVLAVVVPEGIYAANDMGIETHAQLRDRVERAAVDADG